jgi:hypothetical protein
MSRRYREVSTLRREPCSAVSSPRSDKCRKERINRKDTGPFPGCFSASAPAVKELESCSRAAMDARPATKYWRDACGTSQTCHRHLRRRTTSPGACRTGGRLWRKDKWIRTWRAGGAHGARVGLTLLLLRQTQRERSPEKMAWLFNLHSEWNELVSSRRQALELAQPAA